MHEYELCLVEQVIESIDRVLSQLWHTPWAFRLEEDGSLSSDPNCYYFKETEGEEDEAFEEYKEKMRYQQRMWEEYKEVLSLSPFAFTKYEKVQEFSWLDIMDMSWAEIMGRFLLEELPLLRTILKASGYWHMPVPETISDEALNRLIAFRYKERLICFMEKELAENYEDEV